jgi:tetratricopeptide (TPR) repeat protein
MRRLPVVAVQLDAESGDQSLMPPRGTRKQEDVLFSAGCFTANLSARQARAGLHHERGEGSCHEVPMIHSDVDADIQARLSEIEIYRSQGLFEEAKEKYRELEQLIRRAGEFENKQAIMAEISREIRDLERGVGQPAEKGESTQMSTEEQGLIKKLLSLSKENRPDSATLEVAIALMAFGQFEKALGELYELIEKNGLANSSAERILRRYTGLCSLEDTVAQYEPWLTNRRFSSEQLQKIRAFLQKVLERRGIDARIQGPAERMDMGDRELAREQFIDILHIVIPLDHVLRGGEGIKLDVRFQRGTVISVIIPSLNQTLIDALEVGSRLEDVQFYSTAVTFEDACVVLAKRRITSGPKKGDYAVAMKILNT